MAPLAPSTDLGDRCGARSKARHADRGRPRWIPSRGAFLGPTILAYFPMIWYRREHGKPRLPRSAVRPDWAAAQPIFERETSMTIDRPSSVRSRRQDGPARGLALGSAAPLPAESRTNPRKLAPTMAWLAAMGRSAPACALRPRGPRPRFDDADQPRRRQARGARVLPLAAVPLEQAPSLFLPRLLLSPGRGRGGRGR